MIWSKSYQLSDFQSFSKGTLLESLGIELTELKADVLIGTMPVDHRTIQPFGILHGGASVALAESLGSVASLMVIDDESKYAVGLDINANHIRPMRSGKVRGEAKPVFIGRTTHVWEIKIFDDRSNKLTCISRLTMAILKK